MKSIGSAPWSVAQLLASDVMEWAVREAAREGQGIPAAVYLDRLAERIGVAKKGFFAILGGETSPTVDVLCRLCPAIGSNRAAAALAEECGLIVVGGLSVPMEPAASANPDGGEAKNV